MSQKGDRAWLDPPPPPQGSATPPGTAVSPASCGDGTARHHSECREEEPGVIATGKRKKKIIKKKIA